MNYSYKLILQKLGTEICPYTGNLVSRYESLVLKWYMKAWFRNMKAWFRNMIAWFRNLKDCCRWTLWHIKLCCWFGWFSPS